MPPVAASRGAVRAYPGTPLSCARAIVFGNEVCHHASWSHLPLARSRPRKMNASTDDPTSLDRPGKATVGDDISAANASWNFGARTAAAFEQHVRRSIPRYEEGHDLVGRLSDFFVRDDSTVYDLGTSLGTLLTRLVARHDHRPACRWFGVDAEPAMVTRASETLAEHRNVTIEQADICSYDLEQSDLVVAYYCLQFVPPKQRQTTIDKIYESLSWGGAFIWFEKVRGSDARFQDILSSLYIDYKLEQQYTAEEIIAKSRSLKGVLEPFSSEGNRGLLQRAGFSDVMTVFKYICFEGVLAIK